MAVVVYLKDGSRVRGRFFEVDPITDVVSVKTVVEVDPDSTEESGRVYSATHVPMANVLKIEENR